MEIKTIAVTTETESLQLEELEMFSGKMAGICYMTDKYGGNVTNPEKALARFIKVSKTNHHSICEHVNVTVIFENISKILAILLNSIQSYNTSEKSGRYTKMTGDTEKECVLYEKWNTIFTKILKRKYPKMDEKNVSKLSMENARSVLSIFSHGTTMSYTTSLRNWNYIYDWANNVITELQENPTPSEYFNNLLIKDLSDLVDFIYNNLYVEEIRDSKNIGFNSFINISKNKEVMANLAINGKSNYDFSYMSIYEASSIALAQNIRHRTIKYNFYLDFENITYYIPEIIKGTEYEKEWIKDLESEKEVLPQAILFKVIERGTIENLYLKAKERACGRAQVEVRNIMINQMKESFAAAKAKFADGDILFYDMIKEYYSKSGEPLLKCEILKGCKEPCMFKTEIKR